ncbi:MAG TPA: DEAD/DEAH box helicase [Candidatus Binataceae bacterium]|nr:DEAD/DEAH box helicase [Candidatus Binataceae bacterium]
MASVLDAFHPAIRAWFEQRFGAPSEVQARGWPLIAAGAGAGGHHVLLCAPTGSGKTLAAFMWAIDRLVREAEHGELRDELSILYISPLKALANDIRINLAEPLEGVRTMARAMGLELAEIRAALRHGDTPAHERTAMLRRAPHILVTTPESLFIALTSPRFREKLASVRYVIVDELHAIASNKRGAHLMVTLERLDRLASERGARPVRIGLSATLNPIERLAGLLAGYDVTPDGTRAARPVKIVRAERDMRQLDLAVIAPGPDLGPIATHPHWEAMYDRLAELIGAHRTTLVFTLSRRWAERIALNLQKRLGADAVLAHHGSLARRERVKAEQQLKRGELKAIVATASLELGIDVGAIDLVCQVDSPKTVSAAIQRIGRSGHRLGMIPKGRFFALTLDDLIECAAAVRAIRGGVLDEAEIPRGCTDVLAQQIVAIAAEEDEIGEDELRGLLRGAAGFGDLEAGTLRHLLEELAHELPNRISGATPKIFFDRLTRRVRPRRGGRLAALVSGGTIPENGNYDVVIASEGRKIGDVEEDFAQESSRGDIFALGSNPWRIIGISRGRLMVEAAPGMAPSLPFWQTEASGRSPALSSMVIDLRREIAARLERDGPESAAAWIARECALDSDAARQACAYVRRGAAALGAVPDERTIVIERFFDGLGGTQLVIHSPFGIRLNRGFGLALRKRLCQSFDFEIQASAIDDAVLLALNSRHSFALEDVLPMLPARAAGDVMTQAILDAPMFEVRFRHVATRALSIMRSDKGRRIPAWIQRLRSQELVAALFPQHAACFENRPPRIEVPSHFIVAEAVRECLEESADLPRLVQLLEAVERGAVRVVTVDSIAPSVFAHRILLAWDYSFLDDGERANRRSRTVTMNRAMAEEVMRTEDLSALLAADAVAAVEAEVGGRAPARRARDRDELLEMIRRHGAIAVTEIAARVAGDAASMIGALAAEGRIVRIRLSGLGGETLIAAEDAAYFAATYPAAEFLCGTRVEAADQIDPGAARQEIVRRAMATCGPVSVVELANRLGFAESQIQAALAALEAAGAVFRGHFTPAADGAKQWCDRYNLERIHRHTLARLRSEIEPCGDQEFAAFRLRWHHIAGRDLETGSSAVSAVLERLRGAAFSAEFWEHAILPARIAGYRPEHLDSVCLGGDVAWVGIAEAAAAADFPSKVTFFGRRDPMIPEVDPASVTDVRERAVLDALARAGAQYLDELAERANLSERDTLRTLWRLAANGLASNDSFAPLRMLWAEGAVIRGEEAARPGAARHRAAVKARLKSSLGGRWSAVRRAAAASEIDRPREAALMLLARNGVVAREMLALEALELSWREIVFALRRLEYAGQIRRGYFVRSLSGEQYALPAALAMLNAARKPSPTRERPAALSAADPANPFGAMLPACGISREASNLIVIRAGLPIAGLAGRSLKLLQPLEGEAFTSVLRALIDFHRRIVIETIDELPALESARIDLMAAIGFHSDGRALVYDGLPGPRPIRSIAS